MQMSRRHRNERTCPPLPRVQTELTGPPGACRPCPPHGALALAPLPWSLDTSLALSRAQFPPSILAEGSSEGALQGLGCDLLALGEGDASRAQGAAGSGPSVPASSEKYKLSSELGWGEALRQEAGRREGERVWCVGARNEQAACSRDRTPHTHPAKPETRGSLGGGTGKKMFPPL